MIIDKLTELMHTTSISIGSHDEMDEIVHNKLNEAKEQKKNIATLTKEQERGVLAFVTVYCENRFTGVNPLHIFELLKRENYKFKGVYEPLNNVKTEQIIKFMFESDEEESELVEGESEQNLPNLLEEGDYVMVKHDNGESYFLVEGYVNDGKIQLWTEREGFANFNLSNVMYKVTDEKELLVAKIVANWERGSNIDVYTENGEEIGEHKPVATVGSHSFLLLNVRTNELSNEIFGNIEQIAWHIVNGVENAKAVEVY